MDGHDSIDFDGNTIDGHMYSSKSCTMDQSPRFQKHVLLTKACVYYNDKKIYN